MGFRRYIDETARELCRNGRGWILGGVAAGWFLSIGVRLMYPALLPHLQSELNLSLATSGILLTVLWTCYALGQIPAGVLSDRVGERNVLIASTGLSTVTLSALVIADDIRTVALATGCFGLSTALFGVARYTILSAIYDNRDATAIGLTMAAGEAGNAILPPLAAVLASAIAWQLGFGFVVPLFFLVTIVLWRILPKHASEQENAVDTLSFGTFKYVFASINQRSVLLVTAVQVLAISVWQGFTGFYPTYLVEMKGVAPVTASLLFGGFFALGVIVRPLTGAIGDRVGIELSLPALMGSIAIALAVLPFIQELWAIVLVTVASSGLLGYGVLTMTYLTNSLPADVQGTGLGVVRTCFLLVGAIAPTLVGYLAEGGYFDEVFFLLSGCAFIAGIVAFGLSTNS